MGELPERHFPYEPVHTFFFHSIIHDRLHLIERHRVELAILIAERAIHRTLRTVFFSSSMSWIFLEWHATGLTLLVAGLFHKTDYKTLPLYQKTLQYQ